jgi:O-antigen ligase
VVYLALTFPLFAAAFGNLPQKVDFGIMSGMGVLTILEVGLALGGLLACRGYPRSLVEQWAPYAVFLSWSGLTTLWAPPGVEGVQNALVFALFGLMLLLGGTLAVRDPGRLLRTVDGGLLWISVVSLALVGYELSRQGLPTDSDEAWVIGPRPVAILGLVVLSRLFTRWYYGEPGVRLLLVLWMAAIVASISRTAIATGFTLLAVMMLAQARFRRRRLALTLPVTVTSVMVVLVLALTWTPFYQRMFTGDAALAVGGTKINVSGRANMWRAVIASAREHPIIGNGLGSAQDVVAMAFRDTPSQMSQPHNDYLRLWNDLGAVGLLCFLAAVAGWMWILGRGWYVRERAGRGSPGLELTGFLVLLSLSVVELTDNPIVYQTVMGPAGLLIGAALGARVHHLRRGSTGAVPAEPGLHPWQRIAAAAPE